MTEELKPDLTLVPSTEPEVKPEIPRDLLEKEVSLGKISLCARLIQSAKFQMGQFKDVMDAMGYLQALFDTLLDDTLKHPDADLVPTLKGIKEARLKEKEGKQESV